MSLPWGIIDDLVEAPSFADIMCEEYANHLNEVEVRKNQIICGTENTKKSIWAKEIGTISRTCIYSEAAKQSMQTETMVDDDDWEDFTELMKQEPKAAVDKDKTLPPEVLQMLEKGNSKSAVKLSNQVFNQLKAYSQRGYMRNTKKSKMQDRKEFVASAEIGIDRRTRLLLYDLTNNQILKKINGIISAGSEAVILHATIGPNLSYKVNGYVQYLRPECAIKVYKPTLNEFKHRDRYIKDDSRFKDRFSKQNNREFIKMWAEKEKDNLIRMKKADIRCPDVLVLKEHVLVMPFLGYNRKSAPKLKYAQLSYRQLEWVYSDIVDMMHKLYNKAKLVHADLSEYNILYYGGQCYFIDVAQAVETTHPSALEFLMRDCTNIVNFFSKCGFRNISTEKLFKSITKIDAKLVARSR